MNTKTKCAFAIIIMIMAVSSLVACGHMEPGSPHVFSGPLPDLVIDSVSCKLRRSEGSPYRELVYTVSIRNIGDASVITRLYVSCTHSNEDLKENHYSGGSSVKSAGVPVMEPGEVFIAELTGYVRDDVTTVRLMVNPEIEMGVWVTEEGIRKTTDDEKYVYQVNESNYENNTYEFEIPENIPIYKRPEKELAITKYTTPNTQYLLTDEPIKYTFEELNEIVTAKKELPEEVKQCCLSKVIDYIYNFPGYRYKNISGSAIPGNRYSKQANVVISINADGLSSGTVATKYRDSYRFELEYREDTDECELLLKQPSGDIIPEEVYDNAVTLAMEHPIVKDCIEDSKGYYDLSFVEWIDGFKGSETYWGNHIEDVDFQEPIMGVVIFDLEFVTRRDQQLCIYVDMYHGEVITKGPIDIVIE